MHFVRYFLVLLFATCIMANLFHKAIPEATENIHEACLSVSKVDLDVLEKAHNGEIDENNATLVEHFYCFAKKTGVMKNDKIEYDVVKKYIEGIRGPGAYAPISAMCDGIRNTDPKLLATLLMKCIYEHLKIKANLFHEAILEATEIIHKACLSVSKVNLDVLEKAHNGEIDENNAALVDHIYCFAKKAGVMKNDEMQYDVVKKHIEGIRGPGAYAPISAKCDKITNTNPKLLATLHIKCIYKHAKNKHIHL